MLNEGIVSDEPPAKRSKVYLDGAVRFQHLCLRHYRLRNGNHDDESYFLSDTDDEDETVNPILMLQLRGIAHNRAYNHTIFELIYKNNYAEKNLFYLSGCFLTTRWVRTHKTCPWD